MLRYKEILSQTYIVRRRLAVEEFMVCPLCGAVNVRINEECFVCRWAGGFSSDPVQIETRLYDMIYRCPELLAVLVEEVSVEQPTGLWSKLRQFFYRFRRKLDVRV